MIKITGQNSFRQNCLYRRKTTFAVSISVMIVAPEDRAFFWVATSYTVHQNRCKFDNSKRLPCAIVFTGNNVCFQTSQCQLRLK